MNKGTLTLGQSLLAALCVTVVSTVWFQALAATVTLVWEKSPSEGVIGYRIYRSGDGQEPFRLMLEVQSTNATVEVSTNLPYRVFVTAFNAEAESGPGNPIITNTVIPPPPPPSDPPSPPKTPTIIYVNLVNPHRIDVGIATMDLTSQTQVWRSTEGGPWQLMAMLAPGDLHWSDLSAWKRRSYSYRVASCNRYGCSTFSTVKGYDAGL